MHRRHRHVGVRRVVLPRARHGVRRQERREVQERRGHADKDRKPVVERGRGSWSIRGRSHPTLVDGHRRGSVCGDIHVGLREQ